MALAFDTLGYAKRLRDAGIPGDHAEAHAEAARTFIMADLVTKADLEAAFDRFTIRLATIVGALLAAGVGILAILIRLPQ